MQQAICVFSSSSDALANDYTVVARQLGVLIAQHGYALVFGGANTGLMGEVARSVHDSRGRVIGVIPKAIHERGIAYTASDELIITTDLRERKARMEQRASAFIALPGGFGTLEEIAEALTLKQLQTHAKPIVFINTLGFYDRLAAFFEQLYEQRFTKPHYRALYYFAPDAEKAMEYILTYQPPALQSKWF